MPPDSTPPASTPPASTPTAPTPAAPTDRVLFARIGAPHGVRGEVRLFVFAADPETLLDHELTDETGTRRFELTSLRAAKDHFVARLKGIADRDAAAALTNVGLFVSRDVLPPTEDEDDFYQTDLIGLAAHTADGALYGKVLAVHDFGAGDILEITRPEGGTLLLPFTKIAVPSVDIAGGRVVIEPGEWAEAAVKPADADEG